MNQSFETGILNREFFEVATVITIGRDLKDQKTDAELSNAKAQIDHFTQGKILYVREQYYEYDSCEMDDTLKDFVVSHKRRLDEASRLYESLQINPTPALMSEFQKVMQDDEFGALLAASVPNDIRLEFDLDGKRTIETRVVMSVPFRKTRERILERVDDAFNEGAKFISSIAVCGHMRFLPAAAKAIGADFKRSLIGLH